MQAQYWGTRWRSAGFCLSRRPFRELWVLSSLRQSSFYGDSNHDPFRTSLGEKGAETAQQYTWERIGHELTAIFEEILRRKSGFVAQTLTQEP